MTAHTIARCLSPAQRKMICGGHQTMFGNHIVLTSRINHKVDQNLRRKGLAELHDIFRLRLTPLGQSVRAIIEEEGL